MMYGRWRGGRSFDLGRMTQPELVSAHATHPAIHLHAVPAVLATIIAILLTGGSRAGAAAAVAAGFAITCIYEFCHCARHLNVRPRSPHAFNLGYDRAEAARFPWVAQLNGTPPRDRLARSGEPA